LPAGAAAVLNDAPIAMLFTIFDPTREAQEHGAIVYGFGLISRG
jgi:hypothetical protein